MNEPKSPFDAFRMLLSACCSLGDLSSARTPASMSASLGSAEPAVRRSTMVREKTLDGRLTRGFGNRGMEHGVIVPMFDHAVEQQGPCGCRHFFQPTLLGRRHIDCDHIAQEI